MYRYLASSLLPQPLGPAKQSPGRPIFLSPNTEVLAAFHNAQTLHIAEEQLLNRMSWGEQQQKEARVIRFVLKKAWQISSKFLFEDVTRLVLSRCQINTFWKGNPLISGKSRLVKCYDLAINKNQTAASTEIPLCDLRYLGCWRFPGLQVFVGSRNIYVCV